MTLYIIGIGLSDEKDITVKGLEIVRKADTVYLEAYTSILQCSIETLEKFYGKTIILADRNLVEKDAEKITEKAKTQEIAFLVVGDPVSATTHVDLYLRARTSGVNVEVIHNASVMTAVGIVGLQLYKYGKTTSIVFPQKGWDVQAHYDVIKENKSRGLHTLCLLDIKTKEPSKDSLKKGKDQFEPPRFMTVNEAIENLLEIEKKKKEKVFTDDTICIGCARLGSKDQKIIKGTAKQLKNTDFGAPLHCLIVPGDLHFVEEDAIRLWE